jgi:hypothetical protein
MAAAVFLGVTIALAIALLALFRVLFHLMGSDFFDRFPLFPFTFPAAVIVQLCARRFDFEWAVNRRAVEGIGGMAIDGVIICAVGIVVGSDRRVRRASHHPRGCSDWLERLRDNVHRAAHLPAALVRAFHS